MAKKNIVLAGIILIILFYGPVLFLTQDTMLSSTKEDGFYESLGAFFFLLASIVFLLAFKKAKERSILFLLLALAFFFAAGEEISWGQRILNFSTPPAIDTINAQNEFTVHNLHILQREHTDRGIVSLVKGLLNFNRLFILFWAVFCILIPLANRYSSKLRSLFLEIRLPIVSLWFGTLFLLDEITCKMLEFFVVVGQPDGLRVYEVKESLWALVVFLLGVYFYSSVLFEEVVSVSPF